MQVLAKNSWTWRAVAGSLLAHGTIAVTVTTLPTGIVEKKPEPVRVQIQTPPPPAVPTPLPKDDPIYEEPKIVRKPKPRVSKEAPKPAAPVEVRAGLSESTTTNATSNIAVPLGNSAELAVDPSKASLTPPAPVDDDVKNSISENVVDTVASCPAPTDLALTNEAINAGIESGQLVVEVIVGRDGKVREPSIRKSVGYGVDELALDAVRKLKCTPAQKNGIPVSVKGKKLIWNIVF